MRAELQSKSVKQQAVKAPEKNVDIMQMAKVMGNSAVIQRTLVEFNTEEEVSPQYDLLDATLKATMNGVAQEIDRYTMSAYDSFKEGDTKDANRKWVEQYALSHNAASAGYVIETMATNRMKNDGKTHSFQYTDKKGGRPDIVFKTEGRQGIVDITSDAQSGHVMNKLITWPDYSYVSESQYPNLSGLVSSIVKKVKHDDDAYVDE